MDFQHIDPRRWWETPKERIPVVERDPASVNLAPGYVLVRREIAPEKVGSIYRPSGTQKPTRRCDFVGSARLRKKDEPIPIGAKVHLHGHARGQVRLRWQGELYDVVLREDIEAMEVS